MVNIYNFNHYIAQPVKGLLKVLLLLFILLLCGCATADQGLYPPKVGDPENKTVYLLDHGRHSGIALLYRDIRPHLALNEIDANATYIEIGWGDETYYPADDTTSGMTMKAAFWPTGSVFHVAGIKTTLEDFFPYSKIYKLEISQQGFEEMALSIEKQFVHDKQGKITAIKAGQYTGSYFYRSYGTFHLFNNCNRWSAEILREAGLPVSPFNTITSAQLIEKIMRIDHIKNVNSSLSEM